MSRIEDYALIGDGRSAALVDRHGSIDWLCWPRFDSDTCFAALLGSEGDGCWQLAPKAPVIRASRCYRPGTAIVETTLETAAGTVIITDLMSWQDEHPTIIRTVECSAGNVPLTFRLLARFDYGGAKPWHIRQGERWQLIMGPVALWLEGASDLGHDADADAIEGELVVAAGQRRDFVLRCVDAHRTDVPRTDTAAAIEGTALFWRQWSARHAMDGEYADVALRALITLKLLSHRDTGGVVAAPTSSLPECFGGSRNWDYRFSWLRDASFTLQAFALSGFGDHAARWRDWICRAIAGHPRQMQILYGVDGRRRVEEWACERLAGYEHSAPVRFGNGAASQCQIDVFGEVISALYASRRNGLHPTADLWGLECALVDHLASVWREPGQGIWEMRGEPRVFTLSRAMAWVGVDCALKSAREFGLPAPIKAWTELAQTIHHDVLAGGVDRQSGSFTQVYGAAAVDASLLLLPIHGFLPADDPRIAATVARIETELDEDGLLLRYRHEQAQDGQTCGEGTFLACSFWLAHVMFLQGRGDEARRRLHRAMACGNDLGLFSEEYDVHAARACGNFPQALTQVALVNTLIALHRASGEDIPRG